MSDKIEVGQDGLVKVGGVPLCRVRRDGGPVIIEVVPRSRNSRVSRVRNGRPAMCELSRLVAAIDAATEE